MAALVVWTAFASVFSLLLGYSRVPYAAARDGNYFRFLDAIHPRHRIPHRSLIALGLVASAFCFLSLTQVITMLVITRILLQFFLQHVGVILLRIQRPELDRPFSMPLYPLAAAGRHGGLRLHAGQPKSRAGRPRRRRRHRPLRHTDLPHPRKAPAPMALRVRRAIIQFSPRFVFLSEAGQLYRPA